MKKFVAMTAAVVAFGMIMTGCGSNTSEPAKQDTTTSTPAPTTTTGGTTDKSTASTGNEQVVHVTASNFKWELDKTEVKKGQPVKLVIDGKEGMHGLTIQGTPVDNLHTMAGKAVETTFTPDKAGDLTLECTLMCGTGHAEMKTTLKVVD